MNLFAFTEPGGDYPGYVSINRVENGIAVTVRSSPKFHQIRGYPVGCVELEIGGEATLTIPINTPEAAALEALATPAPAADLTDAQWERVKVNAPKPDGLTPITPDAFGVPAAGDGEAIIQSVIARFPDWQPTPVMLGFARACVSAALGEQP